MMLYGKKMHNFRSLGKPGSEATPPNSNSVFPKVRCGFLCRGTASGSMSCSTSSHV